MLEAIVFDMTDTLQWFDFKEMWKQFEKMLLFVEETREIPIEEFRQQYREKYDLYQSGKIGNDWEFFQKIFSDLKVKADEESLEEISRAHLECRKRFVSLHPGLHKIMQELKKNYELGMLSNGVRSFAEFDWNFLKFEPKKYFKSVLYSQDTGILKPDKKAFEIALKELGVQAGNAAMVGDNPKEDIFGAKNAGMKAVYFNRQKQQAPREADAVVESLAGLGKALKGLQGKQ